MFAKHTQGITPHQAQTAWPTGTYEEHHGRDGFAGDCSQLYRSHPTTQWQSVDGPLRPRAIMTDEMSTNDQHDPRALPTRLLYNEDISVSVTRRVAAMPYYFRNLDGDTVFLPLRGTGTFISDYGLLTYGPREYVVIPKGTNYRLVPDGPDNLGYVFESRASLSLPDRSALGHFLPFDIGVLDIPQLPAALPTPPDDDRNHWEILAKRDGELSSIVYDFDPMDVVGWQGTVTPFRLRLSDIRPLTAERLDVPPITHATFRSDGVWFCTFCPRPWQTAPDAAPVQSFHRNVDYDELIIHLGSDEDVPGPKPGLMTVTPGGMNHGPSKALIEHPMDRMRFYMLNVDTARPLRPTAAFEQSEIADYADRQRFGGR